MSIATSGLEIVIRRGTALRRYDARRCGDEVELRTRDRTRRIPAAIFPTELARDLGLRPRPRRPGPELVVVERQALEAHLASDARVSAAEARRQLGLPLEAPDELAETLGMLPEVRVGSWRLAETGSADAASLEAVDGGPTGWWQILAGDGPLAAIAATTGRLLWEQLTLSMVSVLRGESEP